MDLKRAWRNGFLISVVFALPLSDLYNFQQSNLIANGSSYKKQQATNCAKGSDCAGFENKTDGDQVIDAEEEGLTVPADLLARLMLESSGSQSGNIRNAALHFTPQVILRSVDLTDEENEDIADDIRQLIDTDISSLASLPYGFGGSTSSAPGHSGPFAPAGFAGGSSGTASGSLNALSDAGETQTETDVPSDSDALHNVPEPSSLVLMTFGTISVAVLFHSRKPKTPATHI